MARALARAVGAEVQTDRALPRGGFLVDGEEGDAVLGGDEVVLVAHGDDDLVVLQERCVTPLDGGLISDLVEGGDSTGAGGHPALDLNVLGHLAVQPGHGVGERGRRPRPNDIVRGEQG